jgi:hypothetical protein
MAKMELSLEEIKGILKNLTHQPVPMSSVNADKEDGNKDCEPVDKEMFRKVFLPSGKNKNGSTPLVVASTPTGFYIRSQKSQDTHSKLYGPFIPSVSNLPLCYSFAIIVIIVFVINFFFMPYVHAVAVFGI